MNIITKLTKGKQVLQEHFAQKNFLDNPDTPDWQQYLILLGYATRHWSAAFAGFTELLAKTKEKVIKTDVLPIPIYGFVLGQLYKMNKTAALENVEFQKAYATIIHLHHHLYAQRDPNEEGIYFLRMLEEFHGIQTRGYKELKDKKAHFQIQDPCINTILYWSNEALQSVGSALGEDISYLLTWNERAMDTFQNKLWNQALSAYLPFDCVRNSCLEVEDLSNFIPIAAGIPDFDQVLALIDRLNSQLYTGTFEMPMDFCTTLATDATDFNAIKPYHGAISILFNWMLAEGITTYYRSDELLEIAQSLKHSIISKVLQFGFLAHYDANTTSTNEKPVSSGVSLVAHAIAIYWDLEKVDTFEHEYIDDY